MARVQGQEPKRTAAMSAYIVDANTIFSAVISGKESYIDAFSSNTFYLPDFALSEIQRYQQLLLHKTKLAPEELRSFTLRLFSSITIVPNFLVTTNSYLQAFQLCKDIDEDDTPYLALAIEFYFMLITKDEKLVKGLREKGFDKVISLTEFLKNQIV
jgi:predicted nucleic acid-binding protein